MAPEATMGVIRRAETSNPVHRLMWSDSILTSIVNPFARRENYEKRILILYRGITIIAWLLVLLLSLVYSIDDPKGAKTIQRQNADHPSPFALSPILVAIYWSANASLCLTYTRV